MHIQIQRQVVCFQNQLETIGKCAGIHRLAVIVIHTVVLVAGTHLLQGVDDDQHGIRVLIDKADKLFLQPLPDAAAFRLHDHPFGCFFAAHKLEKALLQAVEGILQREIKHGVRLYFAPPHGLALRDLQAQPQGQPAFARFARAGKQRKTGREQSGMIHLTGGIGVKRSSSAEIVFGSFS